jgi:hypothetical protein
MVKRSFVVVLVALALVVAGCGGSNTTPRTAAGVRSDYRSFVQLLAAGEGKRACEKYVSAAFKAALAADKRRGSCPSFFESAWAKGNHTVSGTMAALRTVRINGTRATISTKKGSRAMLYADGHWQDAPAYKVIVTDPTGGTFSIARNPDGSITRTCHPAGAPGCSAAGTW